MAAKEVELPQAMIIPSHNIQVKVPEGSSPGDQITVQDPSGIPVAVTVPPGFDPGDEMTVEVPISGTPQADNPQLIAVKTDNDKKKFIVLMLLFIMISVAIPLIVIASQGGFSTFNWCKPPGPPGENATNATTPDPKCRQVRGSKRTGRYYPGGSRGGGSCFTPGTLIMLEDERKPIDLLEVGDRLKGGGLILATMKLARGDEPLYDISGVVVSSTHTVRDPSDGVWRHAKNVKSAQLSSRLDPMLYNLITENHRVLVSIPDAESKSSPVIPAMLETADFMERDDTDHDLAANLRELNSNGHSFSQLPIGGNY